MAATIQIREFNGAVEDNGVDITDVNSRYCLDNDTDSGLVYPLLKPGTGLTNYSYEKYWALYCTTPGPSTQISNIKWYPADANPWTGIDLYVGSTDTYTQPTGVQGVSAAESIIATTDAFTTYDDASPLTVPIKDGYTTGTNTRVSEFVVTQLRVSDASGPGVEDTTPSTWSLDEI